MSETSSTPFNAWSLNGEPDPHGDYYIGGRLAIMHGKMPDHVMSVALEMPNLGHSVGGSMFLTAAKERLRWLSRMVKMAAEKEGANIERYNEIRASMPLGELTDDQLANQFFLTENTDDMTAGAARIKWLSKELKAITGYQDNSNENFMLN